MLKVTKNSYSHKERVEYLFIGTFCVKRWKQVLKKLEMRRINEV
jgi:hypothetical protein